jgi:DnaJ-class molecular chaperone
VERDVEVPIEKGICDGHRYTITGMGDELVNSLYIINSLELIQEM